MYDMANSTANRVTRFFLELNERKSSSLFMVLESENEHIFIISGNIFCDHHYLKLPNVEIGIFV